jgi:hypothetical protein
MDIAPLNAPVSDKGRAEVIKLREGLDVAARHFVYKLSLKPFALSFRSISAER